MANAPEHAETELQRSQRQLLELLNEVRVAMPGVQVLFAFLLALPFQARFAELGRVEKALYFAALLAAATSSACFVASAALHRLLFRHGQRAYIISVSNRLSIAGIVCLAVAMATAITLVTAFIYSAAAAVVVGGGTVIVVAGLWFGLPLSRRLRREADGPDAALRSRQG
ncbi:MAG TPA: DUF6328 family protein [Solirubrobacteraceae bacterium]|nr:DUF6328 family protein [Solirubrobacteraceae bacterium]